MEVNLRSWGLELDNDDNSNSSWDGGLYYHGETELEMLNNAIADLQDAIKQMEALKGALNVQASTSSFT